MHVSTDEVYNHGGSLCALLLQNQLSIFEESSPANRSLADIRERRNNVCRRYIRVLSYLIASRSRKSRTNWPMNVHAIYQYICIVVRW